MIKILIVDDSPTARLLIRMILESDPELQVVGEARNGEEAIRLCANLEPDLVTMDVNMPGMNGFEAIRWIMSESPRPILVLTGIDSHKLVEVSFKALELGALTVLPKPFGLPAEDTEARHLIEQVRVMASVKVVRRRLPKTTEGTQPSSAPAPEPPSLKKTGPLKVSPRVVAIGASTGGPPALQVILGSLRPDFPLPIVLVQHISSGFITVLAEWLDQTTPLECKIAHMGEQIKRGGVYLAPDNAHMRINPNGLVSLEESLPVAGLRPSINILFESIASTYGAGAIGVLLTGMGADGAQGLTAMRQAGAYTIAQDELSSVVYGMPKIAVDLGAALEVLSLEHIAVRLNNLTTPANLPPRNSFSRQGT